MYFTRLSEPDIWVWYVSQKCKEDLMWRELWVDCAVMIWEEEKKRQMNHKVVLLERTVSLIFTKFILRYHYCISIFRQITNKVLVISKLLIYQQKLNSLQNIKYNILWDDKIEWSEWKLNFLIILFYRRLF